MRSAGVVLGAVLMGGCAVGPGPVDVPKGPCESAKARIEVAPPDGEFGDIDQGGPLWCGSPPQGGAPYSPFRVRLGGPEGWEDGVDIEMSATDDDDGSVLGSTGLTMGLACANVGDSAGLWVGSEAHLRYDGWNLDELNGRSATVKFTATAMGDDTIVARATFDVVLTLDE